MSIGLVKVIISLAVIAVSSVFLYGKYLDSQRDIHELALNQQANIAITRKEDETAAYRNNQTPHGLPLFTGLQIRQGFRLRNGNIRDIWSVVMSQKKRDNRFTFYDNDNVISCDVDNMNAIFKRLVQFFTHNDCYNIGIAVPVSTYHGFLTAMACWTHGLTVHTFNQLPRTQPHDVDLLVVSESQLKHALMFKYKRILVVTDNGSSVQSDSSNIVVSWDDLGSLSDLSDKTYDYHYDSKYDEGTPLVDTHNFVTTSYTHQNFVSAVASVVKSLPFNHEFSANEILLVGYSDSTVNYWPKVFGTILLGGSVIIGSASINNFKNLIVKYKPSLLSFDIVAARKYLLPQENQGLIYSLKMERATHLLSEGIFTELAMLPEYSSLRLIFIGDDGTVPKTSRLTSKEITAMRAQCGARIICERFIPGVMSSVLSTNFFDYRIFSNDKLVNRGASSQSLEIKLYRYKQLSIEKRHGELCIRGFTIGKPTGESLKQAIEKGERVGSEGWMPTGVIGKFGIDGCFYED